MLRELVDQKMQSENLSLRAVSKQVGVAHTTIRRVLNGDTVDMPTIIAITNWLGVTPADVLGAGTGKEGLAARLAVVLAKEPRLADIFSEAIDRVERGDLDESVINDLASYAAYRMNLAERVTDRS